LKIILLIICIIVVIWCLKKIVNNVHYNYLLSKCNKYRQRRDELLKSLKPSEIETNKEFNELQNIIKGIEIKLNIMDMFD